MARRGRQLRIVLGDGQRLFIDAMAAALTENGVTVLAVATSPAEVLAAVGRHRPDICLLATRFNGHDDFGLLDLTGRRYPQVKIVMLADNAERRTAQYCRSGARQPAAGRAWRHPGAGHTMGMNSGNWNASSQSRSDCPILLTAVCPGLGKYPMRPVRLTHRHWPLAASHRSRVSAN